MTPEHKAQCKMMKDEIGKQADSLREHITDEKSHVSKIEEDIRTIKENHLVHIQTDITKLATNQEWLMKLHYIVVSSSVGALIVGMINMIK